MTKKNQDFWYSKWNWEICFYLNNTYNWKPVYYSVVQDYFFYDIESYWKEEVYRQYIRSMYDYMLKESKIATPVFEKMFSKTTIRKWLDELYKWYKQFKNRKF